MTNRREPSATLLADQGRPLIVIVGEADLALSEQFAGILRAVDVAAGPIAVDLSRVTFMDSTMIGFLLRLRSLSASPVTLVHPSPKALRLLQLTAVDDLFQITASGSQ